nr:tyrosine-type recombinase/integrase [Kribbella qitaiheensis]
MAGHFGRICTTWRSGSPPLRRPVLYHHPRRTREADTRYKADYTAGMHALRHYFANITLADGVNIKELSEYLGHYDPGFTLQMYTHMLPSSYDRARQAVDRRLERLAPRLTEQRRSRAEIGPDHAELDSGPDLP